MYASYPFVIKITHLTTKYSPLRQKITKTALKLCKIQSDYLTAEPSFRNLITSD